MAVDLGAELSFELDDVVMIELDLAEPWQPPEPPSRRRYRRWIAPLLAALLVATMVGADGRPSTLAPLIELHQAAKQVVLDPSGMLYTESLKFGETSNSGNATIRGYHLPGGELWNLPVASTRSELLRHGDVLVVTAYDAANAVSTLRALDAATGRELWSKDGAVVAGQTGDLLILADEVRAGAEGVSLDPKLGLIGDRRIAGVNARTGATVWSTVLPARSVWVVSDRGVAKGATNRPGASMITVFEPDGLVRMRDMVSGDVMITADIGKAPENRYLVVSDANVLMLWEPAGGESRFHAYDLKTGQETWSVKAGADGFVLSCGEQVCLSTGSSTTVLDLSSGTVLRRLPAWQQSFIAAERMVTTGSDDQRRQMSVTSIDTGSTVRVLRGWTSVGTFTDGRIIIAQPEARFGRTVVGALDPTSGQVKVLGVVSGLGGHPECQGSGAYLACTAGFTTRVWRIDASALA